MFLLYVLFMYHLQLAGYRPDQSIKVGYPDIRWHQRQTTVLRQIIGSRKFSWRLPWIYQIFSVQLVQ